MIYAVDIETTSLDYRTGRILGMGYYASPQDKGYITCIDEIKQWLEAHANDHLVMHRGQFDCQYLAWHTGIFPIDYWDTMLGAYLIFPMGSDLDLESCYAQLVKPYPYKDTDFITTLEGKSVEEQAAYCLLDCEATLEVCKAQLKPLASIGNLNFFLEYMMPAYRMLMQASYRGIAVDADQLESTKQAVFIEYAAKEQKLYDDYASHVQVYEREKVLKASAKNKNPYTEDRVIELMASPKYRFNFGSDQQIKWLFIDKMKLLTRQEAVNKKKKFSLDKDVLARFGDRHEIIGRLLELKHLSAIMRQCETYKEAIKDDGRIHTSFSLSVTDTGRSSSSDPNVQNPMKDVPNNGIRRAFVARPGYKFVVADSSMIEPRLMAEFSQDPTLLYTFKHDLDFYGIVVDAALNLQLPIEAFKKPHFKINYKKEREFGKILGLSVAYGLAPPNLAKDLSKKTGAQYTFAQARAIIDSFNMKFVGIGTLRTSAYREVMETGRVTTLFGCKQWVPKDRALHVAINTKVQRSASDLCLFIQGWTEKEVAKYNLDAQLVNFVHDEGVWEVRDDHVPAFKEILHGMMLFGWKKYAPHINLSVPLDAELFVGQTWAAKE